MRLFVAVFPPAKVQADLRQALTSIAPTEWQTDLPPRPGEESSTGSRSRGETGSRESTDRRGRQEPGLGEELLAGGRGRQEPGLGEELLAGGRGRQESRPGDEPRGRQEQARAVLRLTPVERWHLTLVFLGEVADERLADVEKALDGVPDFHRVPAREPGRRPAGASPGRAVELRLAGAGRFDNGGSSALWAGVAGDLAGLSGLQADIRAGLVAAGLPADDRAFRPHLTIAYSRGGRAPVSLGGYAGPTWTVDEFVLVRSRFHQGGGYDHLGVWAC